MKRSFDVSAGTFSWLAVLLLVLAGTLVYANTFHAPFVFDDINFITRNAPHVHMTELSMAAIRKAALEGIPKYRYLPKLSFAVNYYFGRENPFGYHLVNLGIHLLTGICLFFLFRITLFLGRGKSDEGAPEDCGPVPSVNDWAAFFGALLWLVHPVQTNAVTYLCQRMTSMAALFYVLSLLLYAVGRRFFRSGRIGAAAAVFSGCVMAGLCALASKENAGTLPVFILLYEWFFFHDKKPLRSRKPLAWTVIGGLVFIAIVFYFMGFDPVSRILGSYARRDFTLSQRVLTECRVVVYYVSLLVFPHPRRLVLDHDYPLSVSLVTPISTITSLGALIGLVVFALYAARKNRLASFAVLWFLGNLVIESSVIGIEIIYEHRNYLPSMFLFLWFSRSVFRMPLMKKGAALIVLAGLAMLFAIWAHQRNAVWQTEDSFWRDNIQKSPGKARPYQNLAYSRQALGDYAGAIDNYKKSLAVSPHPTALANMGLCFESIGYYSDAADAYALALKMKPDDAKLHTDLAVALVNMGEWKAAISHFEAASRLDPENPGPRQSVMVLRSFLDQCGEPLACINAAISQKPENAELYLMRGMIQESRKDTDAAMSTYATVLRMIGETDRKLYVKAVIRLAFLHAANGDMEETRRLLEKGVRTAGDHPDLCYEMAAFYASLSQTKEAAAWLDRAIGKGFRQWDRLQSDLRMESLRNTSYYRNLKRSD